MFSVASTITIALGLLSVPSVAQQTAAAKCAPAGAVHGIFLRGESLADDGDPSPLNVLYQLSDDLYRRLPGSTVLGLRYDFTNSNKLAAAHNGSAMLQQYVADYAASCPDSKISLMGYSLGAVAVMDAICGTGQIGTIPITAMDSKYNKNVAAIVAYGDETHAPNQPWNVGNCTNGVGYLPRFVNLGCAPFAKAMRSYCDYYDEQCCSYMPNNGNQGHHSYMTKYNGDVVNFIASKVGK
ncbi:putative acetylxylan esterase precursor [Pseudovirgaria hyperparasitica]|uniref:Putative acetylxylan esterase n=1 Tax=Pseudovirgaria hyperparasitica TaxID=470096 RepID=A0A6A6WB48_9PEZI|nr:putative acetylxylan esterase precursor [Pseudovirgaria hyperparasitica]KAF2758827.1 putative acetylxylan esterase precursor [Pseudovirgaria hyperparasitica]